MAMSVLKEMKGVKEIKEKKPLPLADINKTLFRIFGSKDYTLDNLHENPECFENIIEFIADGPKNLSATQMEDTANAIALCHTFGKLPLKSLLLGAELAQKTELVELLLNFQIEHNIHPNRRAITTSNYDPYSLSSAGKERSE